MARITAPTKCHGGKWYLAEWLISLMPPHAHYLEPFFGGGSVLLRKDPDNVAEVVCDRDESLSIFWRVLRDEATFAKFKRMCEATPFSQIEWDIANEKRLDSRDNDNDVEEAFWFFVLARQSMSGRQDCFTPVTTGRRRRRMNEQVSAWLTAVEGLQAVHERLKRVLILSPQPAQRLLPRYDQPDWLFYLDPPYHPETRKAGEVYTHEMTHEDHSALLDLLLTLRHAKVMISGYQHELYDTKLAHWTKHSKSIDNKSSKQKVKPTKTEVVYCNF